jgi:hypothetical protein
VATSTILYVREKKKMSTLKKDKKAAKVDNNDKVSGLWTVFSQIAIGAFIPGVWNLVKGFYRFGPLL